MLSRTLRRKDYNKLRDHITRSIESENDVSLRDLASIYKVTVHEIKDVIEEFHNESMPRTKTSQMSTDCTEQCVNDKTGECHTHCPIFSLQCHKHCENISSKLCHSHCEYISSEECHEHCKDVLSTGCHTHCENKKSLNCHPHCKNQITENCHSHCSNEKTQKCHDHCDMSVPMESHEHYINLGGVLQNEEVTQNSLENNISTVSPEPLTSTGGDELTNIIMEIDLTTPVKTNNITPLIDAGSSLSTSAVNDLPKQISITASASASAEVTDSMEIINDPENANASASFKRSKLDFSSLTKTSIKNSNSVFYKPNHLTSGDGVKDTFIAYNSAIKYFLERRFSTIGITTESKTFSTYGFNVCNIVTLDEYNTGFPLMTGFISDEKEMTYVSLLRAFFYALKNTKVQVTNIEEVWNEDFKKTLYDKKYEMPVKVLLIGNFDGLVGALRHFSFFKRNEGLNFVSVLQKHLGQSLSSSEMTNLKFMNLNKDNNEYIESENYILVKFCTLQTAIDQVSQISCFFPNPNLSETNFNLHPNRITAYKKAIPFSESSASNKRLTNTDSGTLEEKTDFGKTGFVLPLAEKRVQFGPNYPSVEEPHEEFLNMLAVNVCYRRGESLNGIHSSDDQDGEDRQSSEVCIQQNKSLSLASQFGDEIHLFDRQLESNHWIFATNFGPLFSEDAQLEEIFKYRVTKEKIISFGLIESKIVRMMNTSSLEEGCDLFLAILWFLTRHPEGKTIYTTLSENVFHRVDMYRHSYFLANLMKLYTLNPKGDKSSKYHIPWMFDKTKAYIYTFHNEKNTVLFVKKCHASMKTNFKTLDIVGDKNFQVKAYDILFKSYCKWYHSEQHYPTAGFGKNPLFSSLLIPNTSMSWKILHSSFFKYKTITDKMRTEIEPEAIKRYNAKGGILTAADIEKFNSDLKNFALIKCNRACHVSGFPCKHSLFINNLSVKDIQKELSDDGHSEIVITWNSCGPVDFEKYFHESQYRYGWNNPDPWGRHCSLERPDNKISDEQNRLMLSPHKSKYIVDQRPLKKAQKNKVLQNDQKYSISLEDIESYINKFKTHNEAIIKSGKCMDEIPVFNCDVPKILQDRLDKFQGFY